MVFSFSFEDRAWTADQMAREIALRLWPDQLEFASWESLSDSARRERVARSLRTERHLLVIDNAESITAAPAAIPHGLPAAEQATMRSWVARLQAGQTLVLWGSREDESWVAADSFGDNIYELGGLDPLAASTLADRILVRHHATGYRSDPAQRDALNELVNLLGGYPLPLEVVLPNVKTNPPAVVLAELRAGGDSADPAGLIRTAIEYSHGKLAPAVQRSLVLLAPFTSFIPRGETLDEYQNLLEANHPDVDSWGRLDVAAGLDAAIAIGLAAPHQSHPELARVVPVLPYFLRQSIRDHPQWWAASQRAHYLLYSSLGTRLQAMLTGDDQAERSYARGIMQASYVNCTTAIDYALESAQPVLPILWPVEELLEQSRQYDARDDLLHRVIYVLGDCADASSRQELAQVQHMAGTAAQLQRRFDEAEGYYRQSLKLKLEFGDRQGSTRIYHQLGTVAQRQRRFDEAEDYYRQSLELKLELGDRQGAASSYHQLGTAAHERQLLDQADNYYRQSLELKLEFGDRQGLALTYHQLGMVAQERQLFDRAEDYYRQAVELKLELGDRYGVASTYHQWGWVKQEQELFDQAEDFYRRSLELSLEFGDRHGAGRTYHQLGMAAQGQRRFDQAEEYYRQALQAFREARDDQGVSLGCTALGQLLNEMVRYNEAFAFAVEAAVVWWQLTGEFDSDDIRLLQELCRHLDEHTVTRMINDRDVRTAQALRQHLDRTNEQ